MRTTTQNDLALARVFHHSQRMLRLIEKNVDVIEADCPTCTTNLQFVADSAQIVNEIDVCCPYCRAIATPRLQTNGAVRFLSLTVKG